MTFQDGLVIWSGLAPILLFCCGYALGARHQQAVFLEESRRGHDPSPWLE